MVKADGRVNMTLLIKNGAAQSVETESAAALPSHGLRDTALFPVHDLVETWDAMRLRVFAHLNANVTAAHLVRYSSRGARAKKAVEDDLTRVRGNYHYSVKQRLWLRHFKCGLLSKQLFHFAAGVLI